MPPHCTYKATPKDRKYLRLFKKGKSIGFTMRSSLKAKGLMRRANGTRRISHKYCSTHIKKKNYARTR